MPKTGSEPLWVQVGGAVSNANWSKLVNTIAVTIRIDVEVSWSRKGFGPDLIVEAYQAEPPAYHYAPKYGPQKYVYEQAQHVQSPQKVSWRYYEVDEPRKRKSVLGRAYQNGFC